MASLPPPTPPPTPSPSTSPESSPIPAPAPPPEPSPTPVPAPSSEPSPTPAPDAASGAAQSPSSPGPSPTASPGASPTPAENSAALTAASADADAGAGAGNVGDPVTPCAAGAPGNLKVTVLDAKTGKPIPGATVDISGPNASTGDAADGKGVVEKKSITPGAYTATAKNTAYTTETGSATVAANATATIEIKLRPITVTIKLGQPVACPGHPLDITATGDPAGGTFAWTIAAPAADLVEGAGASIRTGATVNLLGYAPDTATGNIPAQTATITVTYTFTNGEKATANQDVTIHKIEFVVTNDAITAGVIGPQESATGVTIGPSAGNREIVTDPKVEIQLDASCPRKAACAGNYRVGWLQTMQSSDLRIRYRDSLLTWGLVPAAPIRDAFATATFPFYSTVTAFTADRDKQTAHHEDSPNLPAGWTDPRPTAPTPPPAVNGQLRLMFFNDTFTAWLVVQSVEWSAHDMNNSFAFLRNFNWSSHLDITVDTTKAVGSRCAPASANVAAPASPGAGKGGNSPNLKAPIANSAFTLTTAAAAPPV
jgi:hypothetical protein